jgi:hypothetical protein
MWCIAEITPEYRKRMYDLLDLYEEAYDPQYPVVCVDEKSKQLLGDTRVSYPMKPKRLDPPTPGSPEKCDYEYKRNGTRNIFVAVEPKGGKRKLQVTERRGKKEFARFIQGLIVAYPEATKIRIVVDNLNTHFEKSFYETFTEEEAKKILEKIEFHYTPKHASWLNMAEIEINSMSNQYLRQRIQTEEKLIETVRSCEQNRNNEKLKIIWKFTKQDADKKL